MMLGLVVRGLSGLDVIEALQSSPRSSCRGIRIGEVGIGEFFRTSEEPTLGVGEGVKVAIVDAGVESVDDEVEVNEGVEEGDPVSEVETAPGDVESGSSAARMLSVDEELTEESTSGTSGIESIGGKYESLPCCRLRVEA